MRLFHIHSWQDIYRDRPTFSDYFQRWEVSTDQVCMCGANRRRRTYASEAEILSVHGVPSRKEP